MSTIKVDTIATRTGSGNITVSNTILSGDLTGNTTTLTVIVLVKLQEWRWNCKINSDLHVSGGTTN